MVDKINVTVYGNKEKVIKKSCTCSNVTCNGCLKKCNKTNKNSITQFETFVIVKKNLKESDIGIFINMEFIDFNEETNLKSEFKEIFERYDSPITVIDGIVRYCGGIREDLIYNDVFELLS